jgi:hypothetical protein
LIHDSVGDKHIQRREISPRRRDALTCYLGMQPN